MHDKQNKPTVNKFGIIYRVAPYNSNLNEGYFIQQSNYLGGGYITPSGAIIYFARNNLNTKENGEDCRKKVGSTGLPGCGFIFVDVNGKKSPNIIGKDYFAIYVQSDNILPAGTEAFKKDGAYYGCPGNIGQDAGWGCSATKLK